MTVPLPCSCGADAHIAYLGLNYGYVECLKCELRTDDQQMDEAIEDWNRRVKE